MNLSILPAEFPDTRLVRFLEQHLTDMEGTAPDESQHALSLSDYDNAAIILLVGWVDLADAENATIAGTAALQVFQPGSAELKTMRTSPVFRGRGVAQEMLKAILEQAKQRGVNKVYLETGVHDFFSAAHAFYRKNGFEECPPFGKYVIDPHSVFMVKDLSN